MPDALLATTGRLSMLQAWLASYLTVAGVTVWVEEPPAGGPTPFVVLTAQLVPSRTSLAGVWDLADLAITWWAVHDSRLQARAIADLVTSALLSPAARTVLAGTLDVAPDAPPVEDVAGGVAQVRGGATFTLCRT